MVGQGELLDVDVPGELQQEVARAVPHAGYLQHMEAFAGRDDTLRIGGGSAEAGFQLTLPLTMVPDGQEQDAAFLRLGNMGVRLTDMTPFDPEHKTSVEGVDIGNLVFL